MENTQEYLSTVSEDNLRSIQGPRSANANSCEDRSMLNSQPVDSSHLEMVLLEENNKCDKCGSNYINRNCSCSTSINDTDMSVPQHLNSNGNTGNNTVMDDCCNDDITNVGQPVEITFPWIVQFKKLCIEALIMPSIKGLDELMLFYFEHVSVDVKSCYMKPNRAAKLKKSLGDVLTFFYIHYNDLKPVENSFYLNKMSILLSFYMDMEIKASRRGKESVKKISSKLLTTLYLFLDKSIDHILDSVLNAKLMIKSFREICIPILRKVLSDIPSSHSLMSSTSTYKEMMTYVRCLLTFKLWKRIVRGADQRRRINTLAESQLQPPPANIRECIKSGVLNGVLPNIPKSKKDVTQFLIQAKFNVKEKTQEFFKLIKNSSQFDLLLDADRCTFFNDVTVSSNDYNSDNNINNHQTTVSDSNCNIMDLNEMKPSNEVSNGTLNQQNSSSIVSLIDYIWHDIMKPHHGRTHHHSQLHLHNSNSNNVNLPKRYNSNINAKLINKTSKSSIKKLKQLPQNDKCPVNSEVKPKQVSTLKDKPGNLGYNNYINEGMMKKSKVPSKLGFKRGYNNLRKKSNQLRQEINSSFVGNIKKQHSVRNDIMIEKSHTGDKSVQGEEEMNTNIMPLADTVDNLHSNSRLDNSINGSIGKENKKHYELDSGGVGNGCISTVPSSAAITTSSTISNIVITTTPTAVVTTTMTTTTAVTSSSVLCNSEIISRRTNNEPNMSVSTTNSDSVAENNWNIESIRVKVEAEEMDSVVNYRPQITVSESQVVNNTENHITNSYNVINPNIAEKSVLMTDNVIIKQEEAENNENVSRRFVPQHSSLYHYNSINRMASSSMTTDTASLPSLVDEDELSEKMNAVLSLNEVENNNLPTDTLNKNHRSSNGNIFSCFTRDRLLDNKKTYTIHTTVMNPQRSSNSSVTASSSSPSSPYLKSNLPINNKMKKMLVQNTNIINTKENSKTNVLLTPKNNCFIIDKNSISSNTVLSPYGLKSLGSNKVFVTLKNPVITDNKEIFGCKSKQFGTNISSGSTFSDSSISSCNTSDIFMNNLLRKQLSTSDSLTSVGMTVSKPSYFDNLKVHDNIENFGIGNQTNDNVLSLAENPTGNVSICRGSIASTDDQSESSFGLDLSQQHHLQQSNEFINVRIAKNNGDSETKSLERCANEVSRLAEDCLDNNLSVYNDSVAVNEYNENEPVDRLDLHSQQSDVTTSEIVKELSNINDQTTRNDSVNFSQDLSSHNVSMYDNAVADIVSQHESTINLDLQQQNKMLNVPSSVSNTSSCNEVVSSCSGVGMTENVTSFLCVCDDNHSVKNTSLTVSTDDYSSNEIETKRNSNFNRSALTSPSKVIDNNLDLKQPNLNKALFTRLEPYTLQLHDKNSSKCYKIDDNKSSNYENTSSISSNNKILPFFNENKRNVFRLEQEISDKDNNYEENVSRSLEHQNDMTKKLMNIGYNYINDTCENIKRKNTKEMNEDDSLDASFDDNRSAFGGKLIIDEDFLNRSSDSEDKETTNISHLVMDISAVAQEIEVISEPKEDPVVYSEEICTDSVPKAVNFDHRNSSGNQLEKEAGDAKRSISTPVSQESEKKVPSIKIKIIQNTVQMESDTKESSGNGNESLFICEGSGKMKRVKSKRKHKDREHHASRHRSRTTSREDSGQDQESTSVPVTVNKETTESDTVTKQLSTNDNESSDNIVTVAGNLNMSRTEANRLHLSTCVMDRTLCMSQFKFRDFYSLSYEVSPSIPVPYPPHAQETEATDSEKPAIRCPCIQCSENLSILIANYKKLTQYRNARLKDDVEFRKHQNEELIKQIEKSFYGNSDKEEDSRSDSSKLGAASTADQDCSLPLKKRKTLTHLVSENSSDSVNTKPQELEECSMVPDTGNENAVKVNQEKQQETRHHHHHHHHRHHKHHRDNGKHKNSDSASKSNCVNKLFDSSNVSNFDTGDSCSSSNSNNGQEQDVIRHNSKEHHEDHLPPQSVQPVASSSGCSSHTHGLMAKSTAPSTSSNFSNDTSMAAETLLNFAYNLKQQKLKTVSVSSPQTLVSTSEDEQQMSNSNIDTVDKSQSVMERDPRIRKRSRKNAVR
ncbi:uncharacterized protein LOC142329412 isoform X2 [Lycorma delicatula]|uniref:uncharacterized protein LOC142329412 isoform X2 n=1 Tax=Lycorma delicatula TaxID=130591 RepID=UPI003F513026